MPNKFHIFPKRQNLDTIPLPSITINMEMEKDWLIYHVHSDNCSSFSPPTSSWPWSTTDTWKTHWLMDRVKRIFLWCALILLFACAVIVELTPLGMELKIWFFLLSWSELREKPQCYHLSKWAASQKPTKISHFKTFNNQFLCKKRLIRLNPSVKNWAGVCFIAYYLNVSLVTERMWDFFFQL